MATGKPHELLAKALRTLTDEEQGVVLSKLLPVAGLAPGSTSWLLQQASSAQASLSLSLSLSEKDDKVGLLLRLPAPTHAALKQWADEHGPSMNVVVRGLIERFLSEQGAAE